MSLFEQLRRRTRALKSSFVFCLTLSVAAPTLAEDWLLALNRGAMESYFQLDLESARRALLEAIEIARASGVRGPSLAQTYLNWGIVELSGLQNRADGERAFEAALLEDPAVEPDPNLQSPEIAEAFAAAQQRIARGEAVTTVALSSVDLTSQHHAPSHQLVRAAIDVRVAVAEDAPMARMRITYRSLATRLPVTADMTRKADGFHVSIPCSDVVSPEVEYVLTALDDQARSVGHVGTLSAPVRVLVVGSRGELPSALAAQPIVQCVDAGECPPGSTYCAKPVKEALLGEACGDALACAEGLACVAARCALQAPVHSEPAPRARVRRFDVELGFGLLGVHVADGQHADRLPGSALVDGVAEAARSAADADERLREAGYACDVSRSAGGRVDADRCGAAVRSGGFVPLPSLSFVVGYHLSERLTVGLAGRVAWPRGRGPLANIVLGARVGYELLRVGGFRFGALFGLGLGTLQARPTSLHEADAPPFVSSGNTGRLGVTGELSVRVAYAFSSALRVELTPSYLLALPNAVSALAVSAGPGVSF